VEKRKKVGSTTVFLVVELWKPLWMRWEKGGKPGVFEGGLKSSTLGE
jgi:hypothetical protein